MAEQIPQKEVDYAPRCPHCAEELQEVHWRKMATMQFYEYLYMCPHCHKVLGVGAAAT